MNKGLWNQDGLHDKKGYFFEQSDSNSSELESLKQEISYLRKKLQVLKSHWTNLLSSELNIDIDNLWRFGINFKNLIVKTPTAFEQICFKVGQR